MAQLDFGQDIQRIPDASLRNMIQRIVDGLNNVAQHIGVDPVGQKAAPSPVQSLNVKVVGEQAHFSIQDNNPVSKGVHYFIEYDTDPSFPQPQVVHMGTSRTSTVFNLPAKDDSNNDQAWYARAYAQYPGSQPSAHTVFGGNQTPQPIGITGATQFTLNPSTGSGTAAADGRQGGQGFGVVQLRGAIGPKRNVGQ